MSYSKLQEVISGAKSILFESSFDKDFQPSEELFGIDDIFEEDVNYLLYLKNFKSEDFSKNLSQFNIDVRSLRSSYLPIDFYKNSDGKFIEFSSDSPAMIESYENAFMRMLGMPLSSELSNGDVGGQTDVSIELDSAGILLFDIEEYSPKKVSYTGEAQAQKTLINYILDERQRIFSERKINKDSIFINTFLDEILRFQGSQGNNDINLNNLARSTLIKISYLLIPGVQDERISRCINEPGKIIPRPFELLENRAINGLKIKPSLLETIIKIRLDRNSGKLSSISSSEQLTENIDNFGIIEALFVTRLYSAIKALSEKLIYDIEELSINIEKYKEIIELKQKDGVAGTPTNIGEMQSVEETLSDNELSVVSDGAQEKLDILKQQKNIEDAIISLLNDNLSIPEISDTTSNSIYDGQLISTILNIIDLPRQNISKEIQLIERARKNKTASITAESMKSISFSLGLDIGIGLLHTLIFSLVLFSIPEESLIGLLSDKQLENLKNDFRYKSLLPEGYTKKSTLESINEMTRFTIDALGIVNSIMSGIEIE